MTITTPQRYKIGWKINPPIAIRGKQLKDLRYETSESKKEEPTPYKTQKKKNKFQII